MSFLIEVKFEKIGNRIKYTLPFDVTCTRDGHNHAFPRTGIFEKTDGLFRVWLGTKVEIEKAFKSRTVIKRKVCMHQLLDHCDLPGKRN